MSWPHLSTNVHWPEAQLAWMVVWYGMFKVIVSFVSFLHVVVSGDIS